MLNLFTITQAKFKEKILLFREKWSNNSPFLFYCKAENVEVTLGNYITLINVPS